MNKKRRLTLVVVLALVGVMVFGFASPALADATATCGAGTSAFPDVPDSNIFCSFVLRIFNLGITTGYGDGTYRGNNNVSRYEMAAFLDRITQATTDDNEPFIFSVDNQNDGTTFSGDGIVARSYDQNGIEGISYGAGFADYGVYGQTNSTSNFDAGVYGYSSGAGTGVRGYSGTGWGGYFRGQNSATMPDVVLGGEVGTSASDDGILASRLSAPNSDIVALSNDEFHIHLDEDNNEAGSFAVFNGSNYTMLSVDEGGNWWGNNISNDTDQWIRVVDDHHVVLDRDNAGSNGVWRIYDNGGNIKVWFNDSGNGQMDGNWTVSGTKSAAVDMADGRRVVYSEESTEIWFTDYGTAEMKEGAVAVTIPADYLETVNTDVAYHVFLTPLGDCNGLYVTNKTPTSFEVRELGGGTASIAFDYRIVAKRLGYEDLRLELAEPESGELDGSPAPLAPASPDIDEAHEIGVSIIVEEIADEEVR